MWWMGYDGVLGFGLGLTWLSSKRLVESEIRYRLKGFFNDNGFLLWEKSAVGAGSVDSCLYAQHEHVYVSHSTYMHVMFTAHHASCPHARNWKSTRVSRVRGLLHVCRLYANGSLYTARRCRQTVCFLLPLTKGAWTSMLTIDKLQTIITW